MTIHIQRRELIVTLGSAVAWPLSIRAEQPSSTYPTRTVNIIFAFPPGGPSEGVVRLLAEKLSLSLGHPIVIENRPGGAGGSVGTKSVTSAAPDGHTLLLSPPGPLVVAPLITRTSVTIRSKRSLQSRRSSASRKCWSSIR